MKAIVLAAGKGERLGKVTRTTPKPMIEIKGKPILEHNIRWLRSYGIVDIYINLHHLPKKIIDYFGNGSGIGVDLKYSLEEKLLGTAGAVRKIADTYWGDNLSENFEFLVLYGDNLVDYDLNKIINFHKSQRSAATIAVYKKKESLRSSGIVVLDHKKRIIKFIEKPAPHEMVSNLVNTGVYILKAEVLKYILPKKRLDFGNDVFPEMIRNGEQLYAITVTGNLTAIDSLNLLKRAVEQQ